MYRVVARNLRNEWVDRAIARDALERMEVENGRKVSVGVFDQVKATLGLSLDGTTMAFGGRCGRSVALSVSMSDWLGFVAPPGVRVAIASSDKSSRARLYTANSELAVDCPALFLYVVESRLLIALAAQIALRINTPDY